MLQQQPEDVSVRGQLLSVGVPAHVADYLTSLDSGGWRASFLLAFVALMGAGFAVGGLLLWPALDRLTYQNAFSDAIMSHALSYDFNFGSSLVIALFGWIFLSGAIVGALFYLNERTRAASLMVSLLSAKRGPISRWSVYRMVDGVSADLDAPTYVKRMARNSNKVALGFAVVVGIISAYAVVRDVNTHSVFTEAGYVRSPYFPWGSHALRPWSSAVKVELGCNHVTGRNRADDVIYRVTFRDGSSVQLAQAVPLAGPWLDNLDRIDAHLRAANVAFERWRWMRRDPLHPECLSAYTSTMSPAASAQLLRLLRVPGATTPRA